LKIDIYTSTKNGEKHLSVAKGTKIEDLELPDTIDPDLLTLSPFKTRLEIELKVEHNAVDQADVIAQIEEKGYAVHGAKRIISLNS
jgi:hypothetical protein